MPIKSNLIQQARRKYRFLADTEIEIIEDGYGVTCYSHSNDTIKLFLGSLKANHRDKGFLHRFGEISFTDLIGLTLLHEICHVKQWQEYGAGAMNNALASIGVTIDHDDHPFEKEADRFAKREFKKMNLTKPSLCGTLLTVSNKRRSWLCRFLSTVRQ